MARPILAVALALGLASAQAGGFVGVDELPSRPTTARVVLFSLPDGFDACLPLRDACPPNSSSLLVLPATGRSILWLPDSTELQRVTADGPPLPAVGVAPENPASAQYLLPAVAGTGAGLVFAERRAVDGRFVVPDDRAAGDAPGSAPYVPVLAGPSLVGAPPAGGEPERLLAEPIVVDVDELESDPVPALVVRRAPPSRVALAIRPDPSWHMDDELVPLLSNDGIAGLVRHQGQVRLAVAAPSDVDLDEIRRGTPRGASTGSGTNTSADAGDDGDSGAGLGALLAAVGAVAAGTVTAMILRKRRKARRPR